MNRQFSATQLPGRRALRGIVSRAMLVVLALFWGAACWAQEGLLVPVTVEADASSMPLLRGGSIMVRNLDKPNQPWLTQTTYNGFPGHDRLMLANHGHFAIKIEARKTWTVESGMVADFQPKQEANPNGIVVQIHADPNPATNTATIIKVVGGFILLIVLIAWRVMWAARRQEDLLRPPRRMNRVEMTEVADKVLAQGNARLPGDLRIGRYRVEELIGEGGMASVYRVRDEDGTLYAMKIPHRMAFEDPTFMQRFQREISICITFRHPNIIAAFDEGHYDPGDGTSVPYLVMELATGVTLDNYLLERSHSGASPDLSFGLLAGKGIAEALAAAHERQIVHRDIKPGNVILTDKRQIKVMDFGIARSQRSTTMALTSMGGAIGTPAYMAPEQASTSRPVDHRADLYALGVLMYSMFTFKVPFWDENVGSMVLRKLTDDVPSMRTENPEVTRGLDAVVLKLLERDPGKRFQSAIQVLAALEYLERFPDRVPPGLEATALRYDEA